MAIGFSGNISVFCPLSFQIKLHCECWRLWKNSIILRNVIWILKWHIFYVLHRTSFPGFSISYFLFIFRFFFPFRFFFLPFFISFFPVYSISFFFLSYFFFSHFSISLFPFLTDNQSTNLISVDICLPQRLCCPIKQCTKANLL